MHSTCFRDDNDANATLVINILSGQCGNSDNRGGYYEDHGGGGGGGGYGGGGAGPHGGNGAGGT